MYVTVLGAFGMPVEWFHSIVVPIFKWKGDMRNCSFYRSIKLLDHEMMVMERC